MFFKEKKNDGTEKEGGGVSASWQNGYSCLLTTRMSHPCRLVSSLGTDIKKGCETLVPLMMEEGSFVGLHIPR